MDADPHPRPSRSTRKRKIISYVEDEESDTLDYQPKPSGKKTKDTPKTPDVIDLTADSPKKATKKASNKKGKSGAENPGEEKRLRQFRSRAPQKFAVVKERALTQRLFVLSREHGENEISCRVCGSTGNIYTVTIGHLPKCSCPQGRFHPNDLCKHMVYVMLRVLKAPEHISYQLALTSSELRDLITNAPPIPGVETDGKDGTEREGEDSNRKPIDGECPICYEEFRDNEAIVYCKSSCGNNVHKQCMQMWMSASGSTATCPYCRAKWSEEPISSGALGNIDVTGLEKNEEGYLNIGSQLGLSEERDMSTYHSFWVRRTFGNRR